MKGKNVVTINGRMYDAVTGFPVTNEPSAKTGHAREAPKRRQATPHHRPSTPVRPHRAFSDIAPQRQVSSLQSVAIATPVQVVEAPQAPVAKAPTRVRSAQPPAALATNVHQKPQRTQTLHRAAVKRPDPVMQPSVVSPAKYVKSPAISKFGPNHNRFTPRLQPVTEEVEDVREVDLPPTEPTVHPTVAKVLKKRAITRPPVLKAVDNSKALKDQLIKDRLAEVGAKASTKTTKNGRLALQPRIATILVSSLALLLLGGYLTYINLPNLSMKVASTRAGIAARFPNYQPDGYSFSGPIQYAPGEVTINFKSNTNDNKFSVKQKVSNWDSQAVLDNYVTKQSDTYLTYQERGLTIYSFKNQAAWVSGGMLYSVQGDAPLSSEQVLRIATSI